MTSLLNKNARDRISARDALKHPFITINNPHLKKGINNSTSNGNGGVAASTPPVSVAPIVSVAPVTPVNIACDIDGVKISSSNCNTQV